MNLTALAETGGTVRPSCGVMTCPGRMSDYRSGLSVPICTLSGVKSTFDSTYWSLVAAVVAGLAVWQVGTDWTTHTLLGVVGSAAVLACWQGTQHLAQWLAGGVAAISGALLTLVMEAAMNGAPEDQSTGPLVISFAGAAAVSGVLHNRIARGQAARERELDQVIISLPTSENLRELEHRLHAALNQASRTRHDSWRAWWAARPYKAAKRRDAER